MARGLSRSLLPESSGLLGSLAFFQYCLEGTASWLVQDSHLEWFVAVLCKTVLLYVSAGSSERLPI